MKYQYSGEQRKSKTKLTKGAFGSAQHICNYETLRVLKKSDRTKDNCNANGVAIVNKLKVEVADEK